MKYDDFVRYLSAKETVDDRALNRPVWEAMAAYLRGRPGARVLEVGAGHGAMVRRLDDAGLLDGAHYTAIDAGAANVAAARARFAGGVGAASLRIEHADLYDFGATAEGAWDLVIAHAVLDLLDLARALPLLRGLSAPGGAFYFTINFDGESIFEPPVDPALDAQIVALYHRTMDERITGGRRAGHSRTGRRLFTALRRHGGVVEAAGSSDWVVWPRDGGYPGAAYPGAEGYFLHFIIATFGRALSGSSDLDPEAFARWLTARHAQIDRGELLYIAHQLDYFGTWRPLATGS